MEFLVRLLDLLDEEKIAKLRNELRAELNQRQEEKRFLLWVQMTDEQRIWGLKDKIDSVNNDFKKLGRGKPITHYCADYKTAPLIKIPWYDENDQGTVAVIMVDRPFRLQWRNPS